MFELRLLLREDDPTAIGQIARILASNGFDCTVSPVTGGDEGRWQTLIDRLPLGCLLCDEQWRYTHWNPAAERIFGFRDADVLGKNPFETIVPPESQMLVREIFDRLAAGDMAAHGTCINRTRDGRSIHCAWHNTPLRDDAGNFLGVMSLAEDITERQLAEENRAKLRRALEETNRELETVLYVTSHDLRSPLVNILGFGKELSRACQNLQAALIAECPTALDVRPARLVLERDIPESLHFIQASAAKMDALLSGLLRLSRLGRQPITRSNLDMNSLLANVLEALNFQIRRSDARVEIADLPACQGDATQLNQLFTNLLDNALKFLKPGRPGRVRVHGGVSPEGVLYCVQDNGVGIAAEFQERVFDLFHRLAPEHCVGEGLGLTIAHRIAERHGGKIWVESVLDGGCSFFVSLPL